MHSKEKSVDQVERFWVTYAMGSDCCDDSKQGTKDITRSKSFACDRTVILLLLRWGGLPKSKKNSCSDELMIGIAEGGARTHDLEVDLFAVIRATRSTNWATPARVLLMMRAWWYSIWKLGARVGIFLLFFRSNLAEKCRRSGDCPVLWRLSISDRSKVSLWRYVCRCYAEVCIQ